MSNGIGNQTSIPTTALAPAAAGPTAPGPKKAGRFGQLRPFLAPILITCILFVGDVKYGILQSYWHTALAIISAILLEIILRRVATGRWPHWLLLASCYITGISVGIIVQAPIIWPFVICSLLSISSKYALRIGGRHLWNPSNLGVSLLLFLVPDHVVPLSQQFGNATWASLIILCLGSLILYTLGRLHITLTYAAAYAVLALVRCWITGDLFIADIALLTAPAYALFMFFMITDPATTTRTKRRQCAVAVLVAVVETIFRLYREIHAAYYALFIVAPVTNLLEIWWESRKASRAVALAATPSLAMPVVGAAVQTQGAVPSP
jgi:enediyne biosynthesis protein E5